MRQKPQHVGNISSDVPYMLTFLCHIGQLSLYQTTKTWRNESEGKHIQLSLNLCKTQWDELHDSITCAYHSCGCKLYQCESIHLYYSMDHKYVWH